jgi:hypothetical protein
VVTRSLRSGRAAASLAAIGRPVATGVRGAVNRQALQLWPSTPGCAVAERDLVVQRGRGPSDTRAARHWYQCGEVPTSSGGAHAAVRETLFRLPSWHKVSVGRQSPIERVDPSEKRCLGFVALLRNAQRTAAA